VLCAAAALVEGFDNQSMGVAAPRMLAEFGLSSGLKGVILSATALGLFMGAAIGGRVADYLGRKRALTASLLLFGVFTLATTLAANASWLFAARLLTGLGLGGAMPNFISLSSESASGKHQLRAVTMVMAAMPFGGAIAALMALGEQLGWGWRSIFYVGGCAPVLIALLMHFRLPESRRYALQAAAASGAPVASIPTALFAAGRALTSVLLWIGFFFTQLVLLLMLNWLPSLVVGLGLTHTQASMVSIGFNLSGALGSVFLAHLYGGGRRRLWVVLSYAGMALALAAVAAVGKEFVVVALACALAGVFIVGAQLILFALAPLYYSTAMRGTGVGAAVAVGRLGSVVGPLFAGAVLAGGGGSATVLLAIVPFVIVGGGACFALTWRPQNSD
jgi:AAHS family 3-hydroxyphenylpropionic acid transporter